MNSAAGSRSRVNDPAYLASKQYRNADNLNARIALHARFSTNLHQWTPWVFDQLLAVIPHEATLLECGAGPGNLWSANQQRMPARWHVWLTDFSPGMVSAARKALRGDPRFQFSVAEAANLPAGSDTQDAVLAHHMLYHVPDRGAALREFFRVLRPGGLLSVALNGRAHMRELVQIARETPGVRVVGDPASLEAFDMEDAPPEIGANFGSVEIRHYADALAVTEVKPIVDYLASDFRFAVDDREAAQRALAERIARDGVIRIQKSSGLIFARKGNAPAGG